jgi:hypothetical protein
MSSKSYNNTNWRLHQQRGVGGLSSLLFGGAGQKYCKEKIQKVVIFNGDE